MKDSPQKYKKVSVHPPHNLFIRHELSPLEISFIWWLLHNHIEGANLGVIVKTFSSDELHDLTPTAKYHKLRRMLYHLSEDLSLITFQKNNGLLWATPAGAAFDLIAQVHKSNSAKAHHNSKQRSPFSYPNRCKPQRIEAIKICESHKTLNPEIRDEVADKFYDYLNEIKNQKIILKPYAWDTTPDPLILDYITRFHEDRTAPIYMKYMNAWDIATKTYKKAIFLTLTTDPSKFGSVWRSARHFQVAWNRFMSYLTKRLRGRPKYIAAFEFSKKGLLHVHVVFFGVSYIHHYGITKEWQRCGQGKINYVYALRNDNGVWTWPRKRPDRAKDHNIEPKDYLTKYLRKSLYPEESFEGKEFKKEEDMAKYYIQCLHWVVNKRFWSCSRAFLDPAKQNTNLFPRYFFVGTCQESEIVNLLYRFEQFTKLQLSSYIYDDG